MNLQIESRDDIKILRVNEERLVYSMLGAFFAEASKTIEAGARKLLVDLSTVSYIDSASVGCLMDIYRAMDEHSGKIKLLGLQERVETMVSMTGLHNFMEIYRDEASALASF
ncbi:MAG TPA: STAS domain-containing protein [Vicinamibacteria bacterium]|nr:STAS domain-containing protein [Vicinamibacteria bacterium]